MEKKGELLILTRQQGLQGRAKHLTVVEGADFAYKAWEARENNLLSFPTELETCS